MIGNAWEMAGVSVNCELCHHPDWTLIAARDADGVSFPLRNNDEVDLARAFLAYGVQCKRCGHIRFMSKARIEEIATGQSAEDAVAEGAPEPAPEGAANG